MVYSPRILRPFNIIIKNALDENNFEISYHITQLNNVSVKYLSKAKTSLYDTKNDDLILIVIDVLDCNADYIREINFNGQGFTIRKNDKIIFKDEELTIVSYQEKVNLKAKIQFIEVICQKSS